MLYYHRIDVSKGIDVNKTGESKECDICHYWYLLDQGFQFQPDICNGCQNVLMMSMNLCDIAFLNIHGADYKKYRFDGKNGTLKNIKNYYYI